MLKNFKKLIFAIFCLNMYFTWLMCVAGVVCAESNILSANWAPLLKLTDSSMGSFVVATMLSVNLDLLVNMLNGLSMLHLCCLRCYFRYNCTYCLLLLLFSAKCSESPPSFQVVTFSSADHYSQLCVCDRLPVFTVFPLNPRSLLPCS